MNISVCNISPLQYNCKELKRYSNLAPLKRDIVSFSAMKKSQFSDTDLMIINKFKVPIEKFNSNEDFQNWCLKKLNNEYINKKFEGRKEQIAEERQKIIQEWLKYCNNPENNISNSMALFLIDGITSGLKGKNDLLPPSLDKDVLSELILTMREESKTKRNYQIDFDKTYRSNLQKKHISVNTQEQEDYTGWIVIPSSSHDEKNFYNNIEKLQALSHERWCTKTINARMYLMLGDFHLYMEKGQPKLGMRFFKDGIAEIQGEENNRKIPIKYFNIAKKHSQHYHINELLKCEFDRIEKILDDFESKAGAHVDNATTEQLLSGANINFIRDEKDGMLIIDNYHQPDKNLSWDDLNINENDLFKEIKEIKGNADFRYSNVTNLGNLRKIGGNAYFEECPLTNLGNVEEIGGDLNLMWSKIKDTGVCKISGKIKKQN